MECIVAWISVSTPTMYSLLQVQAISGFVALVLLYSLWSLRRANNQKGKGIKAPEASGAWSIIGHLHLLGGRNPVARTLGTMADKYGPAFTIRLGVHRALVVSSWEVIKDCFTTNDKVFATRPSDSAGKYMGYNYAIIGLTPYGPYWRELRKISMLELLSKRRLEMLKHVRISEVDTCIKELYSFWAKKKETHPIKVEMNAWFSNLAFNVVTRMITGKRYFSIVSTGDESEAQRFRKAINQFMYLTGVFVISDALPYLKWMDLQGYLRDMKHTAKELDSLIEGWLQEHRCNLDKIRSSETEGELDFIDIMQSILHDEGMSGYDRDTIIKATALNLILAGSDTTSVTLTWALSLIVNNADVLKKAQDEVDAHVGSDRQVDESDIKNLVYLQAIVKETLRLYPPGPLSLPREAMEDCQVGGYHVSKGTRLLVNIWKLQRDPRIWSEPHEFRPERFLTTHANVDVWGKQFEYIPFSSGRRSCPGIALGMQVLHLALARLLHGFNLVIPSHAPVDMSEGLGITLPKATPLEVLLTPRLPSKLFED